VKFDCDLRSEKHVVHEFDEKVYFQYNKSNQEDVIYKAKSF